MKYTADTSFFMRISEGNQKAIDAWNSIRTGKGRLVIPTVVIVELIKNFQKKGLSSLAEEILITFESSTRISIIPLTTELAKKAGSISYSLSITNFDAVVIATAQETEYQEILTTDPLFQRATKIAKITML